jgi:threonyl-tRNA synthetase
MIHCAIMGSIERFLAVYIEHTEGKFPLWLSPEQLRIATLNQEPEIIKAAEDIAAMARAAGIRAGIDNSNETVGKKIREAEMMKVPYTVVIGGKEVESGKLSPRNRSDLAGIAEIDKAQLIQKLADESKARR